ncbi:MAG: glycosyltransferase, partial [Bacillus sp. (in: firmicutes)]
MSIDVSVIVPVYNVEQYLPRCLDSIRNQTLQNIEIIIVDDGSTDYSGRICDEHANLDPRIRVIHKKNGGLSDARNVGLDVAKGKYISFVDSDDWISQTMYEKLVNLAEENRADISEGKYLRTSSSKEKQKENSTFEITVKNNVDALLSHFKNEMFQQVVWNKIYKRALYEDVRFPIGKIHEDEFITYKILHRAKRLVATNEVVYYYFQRSTSIIGNGFSLKSLDHLEALDTMMTYLERECPELCSIACTKYYFDHFTKIQELIRNRKEIDNYPSILYKQTKKLIKGRFKKYLK